MILFAVFTEPINIEYFMGSLKSIKSEIEFADENEL